MFDFLLLSLTGAGVGLAIGMTGVGGGSLMTPLLLLFGFPLHIAIGTDLLYASLTKIGGMVAHARQGTVQWRLVNLLALGSVPSSLATVWMLHYHFGDPQTYAPLLTTALGSMLMLTAISILISTRLQNRAAARNPLHSLPRSQVNGLTLLAGILLGVCVTLSSVGAGALGAAVLMGLYPALRTARIIGTDIAHAVPLTLIAGLGHLALGNVDLTLLAALLTGSLPAIWLGSHLADQLPERFIRPMLATLLAVLGVRFAFF